MFFSILLGLNVGGSEHPCWDVVSGVLPLQSRRWHHQRLPEAEGGENEDAIQPVAYVKRQLKFFSGDRAQPSEPPFCQSPPSSPGTHSLIFTCPRLLLHTYLFCRSVLHGINPACDVVGPVALRAYVQYAPSTRASRELAPTWESFAHDTKYAGWQMRVAKVREGHAHVRSARDRYCSPRLGIHQSWKIQPPLASPGGDAGARQISPKCNKSSRMLSLLRLSDEDVTSISSLAE